jgi:peptide deformylase
MSEHINERAEHSRLVDPIEHAALLNAIAGEVDTEDVHSAEVARIIDDMLWLAAGKDQEGGAQMVGLAAPQVGVSKRIAIVDMNATGMREEQHMQVFINPRIVEMADDAVDGREGCWSCGDYCANVPRATWVVVEALDREGSLVTLRLEGFTARIAQHEVDHLDGVRCIDRVSVDEPWRLHRVNLADVEEFNRYRTEWPHWQKTFPREEWLRFREGISSV